MSRDRWNDEFAELAAAYWTPERLSELLRGKDLPVTPGRAAPLLRAMGILHRDASMPPRERRKFFQLNHMIRLLRPSLEELFGDGETIRIVDAGCGLSYLTLALAWCFDNVFEHPVRILGVDRNEQLIEQCRANAEQVSLGGSLRFASADLGELSIEQLWQTAFDEPLKLDAVIGLHACDTATDDAIVLGQTRGAKLIAVAPCCQAALARRWAELAERGAKGPFEVFWKTPHLRREMAATTTDAMRALLLEAAGYDTYTVEFVGSEHTPKNTLIRAVKRTETRFEAWQRYTLLRERTGGAGIGLADRIELGLSD